MKYICKYRNHTGAIVERIIDAKSRALALEEFRRQEITPISLVVDNNRKGSEKIRLYRHVAIVTICCLLFLIGILIWYSLSLKKVNILENKVDNMQAVKTIKKAPTTSASLKDSKAVQTVEMPPKILNGVQEIHQTNELSRVRKFGESRPVYTNMSAVLNKDKFDVFKHRAEFEMAALIMIKPGEAVIGDANYNKSFERDLLASLDEPIKIDDKDPDDVNDLKLSVKEMKETVRRMVANGDDVCALFTQTRKELQELGVYKMNIEKNVHDMLKSKDIISEQDMDDCISAANRLLEAKGIAPMQIGGLTKHLIKRRIERQNQKLSVGR